MHMGKSVCIKYLSNTSQFIGGTLCEDPLLQRSFHPLEYFSGHHTCHVITEETDINVAFYSDVHTVLDTFF